MVENVRIKKGEIVWIHICFFILKKSICKGNSVSNNYFSEYNEENPNNTYPEHLISWSAEKHERAISLLAEGVDVFVKTIKIGDDVKMEKEKKEKKPRMVIVVPFFGKGQKKFKCPYPNCEREFPVDSKSLKKNPPRSPCCGRIIALPE